MDASAGLYANAHLLTHVRRSDNITDRTSAAVALAFNVRVLRAAVAGILVTVPMSMPTREKARE